MMVLATGTVSAGQALMNTLIGMGTVFIVLIFISFLISLFKYVNMFAQKKQTPVVETPTVVPVAESVEEEELVDDTELVAVITAAIAAYAGTSSEGFQVRSIKRAAKSTWK